jgi:hypothetical protein
MVKIIKPAIAVIIGATLLGISVWSTGSILFAVEAIVRGTLEELYPCSQFHEPGRLRTLCDRQVRNDLWHISKKVDMHGLDHP